jgi:hypothetical protein|tara:strand:+ start:317 stop:484 length:168 start_codon:yes stop_codon:yes gene_type:complete
VVVVEDPPPQVQVVLVVVVTVTLLSKLVLITQGLVVLEVHHLQTNQEGLVEMELS